MSIVQKGQNVVVGFNGVVFDLLIMDTSTMSLLGDVEEIRDDDNATCTKLISNFGVRYNITGIVKNDQLDNVEMTAIKAIVKGDSISIAGQDCMVEEVELSFSRLATQLNMTVICENSMEASYAPPVP